MEINTENVNVLLDQIVSEYNILKCDIIKDKNNLVFGLDSEDEVLSRFTEYTQKVEHIERMIKLYTDHCEYFQNNLHSSTMITELTNHISEIKSTMTHDVPAASAKLSSLFNKLRNAQYATSYIHTSSTNSNERLLVNKVFTQENMEITDSGDVIISNIIPSAVKKAKAKRTAKTTAKAKKNV